MSKSDKDPVSPKGQSPAPDNESQSHDEELEQLKARVREQDAKLEATSRLLSSIRVTDPPPANPATGPSSAGLPARPRPNLTRQFATIGALAVVALAAGYYSHRWIAGRSAERSQIAMAQPQATTSPQAQPEASAAPEPSLAAQTDTTPESTPTPAPMTAPWSAPTAPAAQSENTPDTSAPSPEAQATVEAKAEPPTPSVPAPDSAPTPDEATTPTAARVEKPAIDNGMSRKLTNFLHHNRLPFVNAIVYAKAGTPRSVALSGQVRTQKGKDDAELRSRDFIGIENLDVHNRVRINPQLSSNPQPSGSADAGGYGAGPGSANSGYYAAPNSGYSGPSNTRDRPPNTGYSGSPNSGYYGSPNTGYSCNGRCQHEEGRCEVRCQPSAPTLGGTFNSIVGAIAGGDNQVRACNADCRQTLDQCLANCGSGG